MHCHSDKQSLKKPYSGHDYSGEMDTFPCLCIGLGSVFCIGLTNMKSKSKKGSIDL